MRHQYSQLVFRNVPPQAGEERATVIALHGANGGLDDLTPFVQSLGPDLRVVTPEAARAVYQGMEVISHTWYGATEGGGPEPVSFGDSLAQLERFIIDEADQATNAPLFLLGYDQGATLALALTGVVPERLAGVIAVSGELPTIRGWSPPVATLDELPVLIINEPDERHLTAAAAKRLPAAGARLTLEIADGARMLTPPIGVRIRNWLVNQLVPNSPARNS